MLSTSKLAHNLPYVCRFSNKILQVCPTITWRGVIALSGLTVFNARKSLRHVNAGSSAKNWYRCPGKGFSMEKAKRVLAATQNLSVRMEGRLCARIVILPFSTQIYLCRGDR